MRNSLFLAAAVATLLSACGSQRPVISTATKPSPLTSNSAKNAFSDQLPKYLPLAHSHNDYEQWAPLSTALEHGFASVEADVHLVAGQLRIGHVLALNPRRTLESLYLQPLRERVRQGGGWVYGAGQVLTLYVDIKTETAATYAALEKVLANYADILSYVEDGRVIEGPVMVIVTGNRDRELARARSPRYSFQDGTLNDLYRNEPLSLIPAVNAKWSDEFRWWGWAPISTAERQKLRDLAQRAGTSGRVLRFWAAPQTERAFRELFDAGVSRINTDDIPRLAEFLNQASSTRQRQ